MFGKKKESIQAAVHSLTDSGSKTEITKEDFLMNAILTANRLSVSVTDLKGSIKGEKDRLGINELLILSAELDMLCEQILELKREHRL